MANVMKVREFIEMDIDVDVVDDLCEELYIAYVGPMRMTEEGAKKFTEVLECNIEVSEDEAILCVNDDEKLLKRARKFFYAAAGYCPIDEYDAWFDVEEE